MNDECNIAKSVICHTYKIDLTMKLEVDNCQRIPISIQQQLCIEDIKILK